MNHYMYEGSSPELSNNLFLMLTIFSIFDYILVYVNVSERAADTGVNQFNSFTNVTVKEG